MDSMDTRRSKIVTLINERGSLGFSQLKEAFPNVSEMTLRTDLKFLDEERRIIRVHGGAKSVDVVIGTDDLLGKRALRELEAKQIITDKALSLIHPHTTIFLDSGSTTTILARKFPDQPQIIYTTGLSCATELARLEKPSVVIPGGRLNRYSMSVCDIGAIRELERVNFDLAFIGVAAFSEETGFSCGVSDEARLKLAGMSHAGTKAVLMDSSKLGNRSTFSICHLDDIDILITDGRLSEEMKELCRAHGVEVL